MVFHRSADFQNSRQSLLGTFQIREFSSAWAPPDRAFEFALIFSLPVRSS